jgi:protein ImuA
VETGFAPDRALLLLRKRMILSPNRSHFGGSSAARTSTLATLRGSIEHIEAHGDAYLPDRVALGHADADATLQGGLVLGAMHEVFAEAGRQSAAATGFVAGLAGRAAARRPMVWVRQDFVEIESGALSMSGLAELGLDPRVLVTVRAADVDTALKTAADALACDALGVVVLEVWGEARQLDLVASRKLTLAAQASGVTGLLLRVAAEPSPSTAETRWIVRAAHSPPSAPSLPAAALMPSAPWSAWGAPVFDAQLVRNRHGPVGRWIMEWKCDERLFEKPAAYPQPVAAAPAHRPYQTPALVRKRRAG